MTTKQLSKEQELCMDAIFKGKNVFITGSAGTGKTWIIQHIVESFERKQIKAAITASTGICACNIGGTTLHHWSGMGISEENVAMARLRLAAKKPVLKRWKETQVLIVDEISMIGKKALEKLDLVGRICRNADLAIGGIQVVFIGDFLQLGPVNDEFAFRSKVWQDLQFQSFIFKTSFRQSKDALFYQILSNIRIGSITHTDVHHLSKRFSPNITAEELNQHTHIYPHRKDVNAKNQKELARIASSGKCYKAQSNHMTLMKNMVTVDEELYLKIGCHVLLCINMFENNLHNGSRGIVIGFTEDQVPIVRFGQIVITVHWYTWNRQFDDQIYTFTQIPLLLGPAITIHKSQGMTLEKVALNLDSNVFEGGQAYVALSRVRSLEDLFIYRLSPKALYCNPGIKKFYDDLEREQELLT